jgi:hypothetical protein
MPTVTRSNYDGLFLWGHLMEHIYLVHARTTEYLMARSQAAVTIIDANHHSMFENAMRCTAVCFKLTRVLQKPTLIMMHPQYMT